MRLQTSHMSPTMDLDSISCLMIDPMMINRSFVQIITYLVRKWKVNKTEIVREGYSPQVKELKALIDSEVPAICSVQKRSWRTKYRHLCSPEFFNYFVIGISPVSCLSSCALRRALKQTKHSQNILFWQDFGVSSCFIKMIKGLATYLRQRRREETQMRMTPRLRKTMNWWRRRRP